MNDIILTNEAIFQKFSVLMMNTGCLLEKVGNLSNGDRFYLFILATLSIAKRYSKLGNYIWRSN